MEVNTNGKFEYRRFIDRKGTPTIVMDLEGYAKHCMQTSSAKETSKDYVCICPYCATAYKHDPSYHGEPYLKRKLYIAKNYEYGRCFRCDQVFVNNSDTIRTDFVAFESPLAVEDFQLVKLHGEKWNLDRFKGYAEDDPKGLEYLVHKRHYFMKQLYKPLHIRFDENHNPVIPFYYHGELIYYQIKNAYGFDGKKYPPYFSPPIEHKPAFILEHGENKMFVISEGTFDGIADLILYPNRTPFCVLGSSITNYQIAMLRSYVPKDILIYMDETSISEGIANKIGRYIDYADIHIKRSWGRDPEEELKDKIINDSEFDPGI